MILVRQVMIPKPDGGERMLGVPAVLDRLIQQAIAQVLVPVFDPGFVPVSYGFRPEMSAHNAVRVARTVIEQGYRWVIEVDLDAFFDRVNHDALMARVARKVKDKRLLGLAADDTCPHQVVPGYLPNVLSTTNGARPYAVRQHQEHPGSPRHGVTQPAG